MKRHTTENEVTSETTREIVEVLTAEATSDGDGVKLKRVFGGGDLSRFDPFLMLDEFGSDKAADYAGGFPPHPHRGFETVTYMLAGQMEHRDHMGNVGLLGPGDVQWMKAGSGVIHSEMPRQKKGLMHGFQLWLNLPADKKMDPPSYRDISADEIPEYVIGNITIKAIAGSHVAKNIDLDGLVTGLTTDPGLHDLEFSGAGSIHLEIEQGCTALIYVFQGEVKIGEDAQTLETGALARLSSTGVLNIKAIESSRVLLMTGKAIGEPIVQRGPFVMNTMNEIQQAVREYSEGTFLPGQADSVAAMN